MKLIAKDLLEEELDCEESKVYSDSNRIELLKDAIKELDNLVTQFKLKDLQNSAHIKEIGRLCAEIRHIEYKSDCSNCKYDMPLEQLRRLSDEDALEMFKRCSNCSNYHESLFESK